MRTNRDAIGQTTPHVVVSHCASKSRQKQAVRTADGISGSKGQDQARCHVQQRLHRTFDVSNRSRWTHLIDLLGAIQHPRSGVDLPRSASIGATAPEGKLLRQPNDVFEFERSMNR